MVLLMQCFYLGMLTKDSPAPVWIQPLTKITS